MPADKVVTFKVAPSFYEEMIKEAEVEGHNSLSDYVKFAIRFYMMACRENRNKCDGQSLENHQKDPTISEHT